MAITTLASLIRLAVGTFLGALIGLERERSGRSAGLRTHLLVAVASTTFMLVSTQFLFFQNYEPGGLVMVDTSRIAAAVVAGVGFLGAGAILRTGLGVHGLTTAAGLWLVAAIGLASGGGMFIEAVAATAVSLIALVLLRRFEDKQPYALKRTLIVTLNPEVTTEQDVLAHVNVIVKTVASVDLEKTREGVVQVRADIDLPSEGAASLLFAELLGVAGVTSVRVLHPR